MRMLFKRLWVTAVVAVTGMLLFGCGQQHAPSGLVYCSEGNPESFNPQTVTSGTTIDATSHQIYNRLVNYDAKLGEITPALATQWQMSANGLQYRFTLRQGVPFHQTSAFTPTRTFNANDVLFSFNRIVNPDHPYHYVSHSGYPFFQSIGFSKQLQHIEKVDDYTVIFHLYQPDASFLSNLATDFAIIQSQEYAIQLLNRGTPATLDQQPIGTGPYILSHYIKNDHIRYRRNPNYWGKTPKSELLVFDITPKSNHRLSKLITGDCDVSALPKAGELMVVEQQTDLRIESQPGLNVAYWAFNTQKAPFNDVRVRRALAHAIDRQNILRAVYQNTATAATGVLPPTSWAYQANPQTNDYNPQKAKALLQQAGITELTLDIWAMPVARTYNPNARKTAELIQADLARVGVTANIISYGWSVFTQKLNQSNYDSVLIGWNADNSDPDNFFTPILSCDSVISGSNRSKWCHPKFDQLLMDAKATMDIKTRKSLYQQAETMLAQNVPIIGLAHAKKLALKRQHVHEVHVTPFGGISFADMRSKEGHL